MRAPHKRRRVEIGKSELQVLRNVVISARGNIGFTLTIAARICLLAETSAGAFI